MASPALHVEGGDVDLAAIDLHVAVGNHLAGGAAGVGEAEAVDDVVEAGLEKLEEDLAGDAAAGGGDGEVAAELAFEDAVLIAQLLLLGEGDGVIGLLAAGAFRAVHAGAVVLAFERLRGAEEGDSEAAADSCFGASVTCHIELVS